MSIVRQREEDVAHNAWHLAHNAKRARIDLGYGTPLDRNGPTALNERSNFYSDVSFGVQKVVAQQIFSTQSWPSAQGTQSCMEVEHSQPQQTQWGGMEVEGVHPGPHCIPPAFRRSFRATPAYNSHNPYN